MADVGPHSTWMTLAGLLVLLGVLAPCQCQVDDDPCLAASRIDMHFGIRESTYETLDTDRLVCDDNIDSDSWVRFVRDGINYNMTNQECVEENHCGAQAPLWMSRWSSHPTTLNREVEATACINYGIQSCCSSFGRMQVRMCEEGGENFYVYKLVEPPGCFTAYCVNPVAGSCPPKFRRDLSTGECIDAYPPQDPPSLQGPTDAGTFSCHVSYSGDPGMETDARFDVRFLFDGMAVQPSVTVGARESASLEETSLQRHLGTKVSCSSTPHWIAFPGDPTGPEARSSASYFIGVEFATNRIAIDEADDEPEEVRLWATLPIVCGDEPCSVCTNVTADGILLTECEYCFPSTGWNPSEKRSYGDALKVSAMKHLRLDETTVHVLKFGPFWYKYDNPDPNNRRSTWGGYDVHDIAVVVSDAKHGLCSISGVAHVISMDGKRISVYEKGQFLLFKSTAARVFEVQVRLQTCGTATCVCAVAVREGNAVLGVDMCGSHLKIKKYSSGSLPPGAYYTRDDFATIITMPSGARVMVEVNTFTTTMGLDVWIPALPEDRDVSSGLCGNFDGDPENDLTLRGSNAVDPINAERGFIKSYRIPATESFFDSQPPWPPVDIPEDTARCHCARDADARFCLRGEGPESNPPFDTDGGDDGFDYGLDYIPATDFTWPTRSGITETEARGLCGASLDSLPYKDDCVTLTGIDVEPFILQCMQDIKVQDDPAGARDTNIGDFEVRCLFLLAQNRTLYTEGDDGQLIPPVQILGKMCPRQCSGRGTCMRGRCLCDAGYTGTACTVVQGRQPVLHRIEGGDHCDLSRGHCKEFNLVTSQVQKSDRLFCRVKELASKAVGGDTPVSQSQTVLSTTQGTATFITSSEIACRLPEIDSQDTAYYQLRFAFSYDGETYSNELDLTVFDGECLSCESDCGNSDSWVMSRDTCIMDGECAKIGAIYDDGYRCLQCDSTGDWTLLGDGSCRELTVTVSPQRVGEEESDDKILLPILCGVAGVLILAVMAIAVMFYLKKRQSKVDSDPLYETPGDRKSEHLYARPVTPSDIPNIAWK